MVRLNIHDVGQGIQMSGWMNAANEEPTPAEIVGLYLAANAEILAQQSWSWYAAQRFAQQQTPKDAK
jgi:hypothetical protein